MYQPILGWRSARTVKRVLSGLREQDASLFRAASLQIRAQATFNADHELESLNAGTIGDPSRGPYDSSIQSMLADAVYKRVQGRNLNDVEHWGTILAPDSLAKLYAEIQPALNAQFRQARLPQEARAKAFEAAAKRESVVGGLLSSLYINKQYVQLANLFSPPRPTAGLSAISLFFEQVADPLETLDPTTGLGNAGLSPVGLVHLFRQYFFEFETFLGPSVQHIWLSPGGTAELIEISTRKTTIERVVESSTETSRKSEKSSTQEDEISDAVKQDNENNTKFGASVSANERWVWGDANETATVEFGNTQKQAREETHKHMRQQTEKLSTEIKQNFKTTFRTITETQDTTSRRYVLQNNTGDLINYELRRKMRQVGVQVQDLGTQLCWQTYVDDPGRELGVAKLVHLAPPPDFSGLGPISELPLPDEYTEDIVGSFNLPPGEHTYAGWRQWMADIQLRPKDGFEYLGCGALRFLTGGSVDLKVVENRITAGQGEPIAPAPPCLSVYLTGGHSDRGGELMQFTIPIRFGPSASKVTEVQGRNSEL
ncbi:MAG TPA: hypothetical protein VK348_00730, partial [Planctomycetota bacterium]|nr:hypothetical protein [Planctomycetota bacterium]